LRFGPTPVPETVLTPGADLTGRARSCTLDLSEPFGRGRMRAALEGTFEADPDGVRFGGTFRYDRSVWRLVVTLAVMWVVGVWVLVGFGTTSGRYPGAAIPLVGFALMLVLGTVVFGAALRMRQRLLDRAIALVGRASQGPVAVQRDRAPSARDLDERRTP
jgi:hypothetical protein